jgi:Protein of unknown function (DUF3800)
VRIYIDEAGNFLPPTSQPSSFSLVLALVIPSCVEKELFHEFLQLRDEWPTKAVEIKGSSLNESQAAQIVDLAVKHDLVVEFTALDMATHTKEVIDDFRNRQADNITANITREHYADAVQSFELLSQATRRMSNQLFVQSFLTIKVIVDALQVATLYFVQRIASELGEIAWIIDRKGHKLTEMEDTWSTLILPMSEFHFAKHPLVMLTECDYSHFSRYETELATDPEMTAHVEWTQTAYGIKDETIPKVVNAGRLLTEQQAFEDSANSLGLQLADMLATTVRRALNGKLQYQGWKNFGRLLIANYPNKSRYVQLGPGKNAKIAMTGLAEEVARALDAKSKPMIP